MSRTGRPPKLRAEPPSDEEILDAIRWCWSHPGYTPTSERLADRLRMGGNSIRRRIRILVERGRVKRATPNAPPVIAQDNEAQTP